MSPRILIVDDHEVVRHGVRSILARARPQWEICGEASDGKRAIESALLADPDVIVLDITMPVMSGLEAAAEIIKRGLRCRVLIFTMHESERLGSDLRAVGAHGYVEKSQASRDLVVAIETLLGGGTFFGPTLPSEPSRKTESGSGTSLSRAFSSFVSFVQYKWSGPVLNGQAVWP
jgi:DNA-binding NarL/FixJ family response regulator